MIKLTMKEKKELFQKTCREMKQKGLEGEEFLEAVYNRIEELYDGWDTLNGFTMNEQWDYDKHCNQWLKEFNIKEN